jgi:4-hydroxy-tetrahydrodipicolinate synthase
MWHGVARLRPHLPAGFRLLSGNDASALGLIASGGDGSISMIANVAPGLCHTIFACCRKEN